MGRCILCGQRAGLFRKQHGRCLGIRDAAWADMVSAAWQGAAGRRPLDDLEATLGTRARRGFVPEANIRKALVEGWEGAVEHLLEDGDLSREEENALVKFKEHFSLSERELERKGSFSRMLKGGILRDLLEGKLPQRVEVHGVLPFNFQKNEQLIYHFPSVEYLEDRTRTHYVGGYQGVSVRIMKGVYYRVGGFRGNPVSRTERVAVDTGGLGVTNRHVYFSGPRKSFRIRHEKIVSLVPFSDGVLVVRDAATAKSQVFVTGDGWFTYNLLSNVSRL